MTKRCANKISFYRQAIHDRREREAAWKLLVFKYSRISISSAVVKKILTSVEKQKPRE